MLTENDVIAILIRHLSDQHYKITQALATNQKGIDIIAERANEKLLIEVKGQTSARIGSGRYGKPFDSAQISTHASEAFYAAMAMRTLYPKATIAVAFPETYLHIRKIEKIYACIEMLDLKVFVVSRNGVREFRA